MFNTSLRECWCTWYLSGADSVSLGVYMIPVRNIVPVRVIPVWASSLRFSYRYETFVPVWTLTTFCTGTRFRSGTRWVAELTGTGSECLSIGNNAPKWLVGTKAHMKLRIIWVFGTRSTAGRFIWIFHRRWTRTSGVDKKRLTSRLARLRTEPQLEWEIVQMSYCNAINMLTVFLMSSMRFSGDLSAILGAFRMISCSPSPNRPENIRTRSESYLRHHRCDALATELTGGPHMVFVWLI